MQRPCSLPLPAIFPSCQERNKRLAGTLRPGGRGGVRPRVHFFPTFFWNKLYFDAKAYSYKEVKVSVCVYDCVWWIKQGG